MDLMSDFLFSDDPMDIDEDLLDDESMDSFFSADIGERDLFSNMVEAQV